MNFHFHQGFFFKVCKWWQFCSSSCTISYSLLCLLFCQEYLESIAFSHCKLTSSSLRYVNKLTKKAALDSRDSGSEQSVFRTKITVENFCFRTGLKESLSFPPCEWLLLTLCHKKRKSPCVQCFCFGKTDQRYCQIQNYYQIGIYLVFYNGCYEKEL